MRSLKRFGFSLIEIMITITVIAILATLSMWSYNTHLIRSRVSEAIKALESRKAYLTEEYTLRGYFSYVGANQNVITNPSPYIDSVFEATQGNASGKSYVMAVAATLSEATGLSGSSNVIVLLGLDGTAPAGVGLTGRLRWFCGNHPQSGVDLTPYLPASCRTVFTLPWTAAANFALTNQ